MGDAVAEAPTNWFIMQGMVHTKPFFSEPNPKWFRNLLV